MSYMKAYEYTLIVILVWSSAATVTALVLKNLNNFQAGFYASIFSTLTLLVFVLRQGKLGQVRQCLLKPLPMVLMGFLSPFLYYILFMGSIKILGAAEAMIFIYFWPLIAVLLAMPILGERLTSKKIAAILISLVGVFIVITKGSFANLFTNLYGDLIAIAAGGSWALFSVLGKKLNYDPISSLFVYNIFSLIFITASLFLFSSFVIPTLDEFAGIAWIGILNFGIAYVLWFKALKLGETAKLTNLTYVVPFLSLVWIFLVLKENIQLISVLGLAVILFGVALQYRKSKIQKK